MGHESWPKKYLFYQSEAHHLGNRRRSPGATLDLHSHCPSTMNLSISSDTYGECGRRFVENMFTFQELNEMFRGLSKFS